MIKHLFTTLCALALITAGSIPALAAEADTSESARYYPISVEEYTYEEQNEPRINKVYQLSLSDNPSGIPTKDFVRNGRLYYLLDMTRKDEVGVDTKPHTETVTRPSDTSNMEEILQGLEAELEVTTEEGYTGVLRLDHTSVQVTTDGYATKTQPLSATRSYPNLAGQDTQYIPKSIEDNGRTLTLQNIDWQTDNTASMDGYAIGDRYTAVATYTGSATSSYVKGYTVTADYSGTVSRIALNKTRYVAIFEGNPIAPVDPAPAPDVLEGAKQFNWAAVLIPFGIVALAGAGIGAAVFYRRRSEAEETGGDDQ